VSHYVNMILGDCDPLAFGLKIDENDEKNNLKIFLPGFLLTINFKLFF
jgi:hypothetical protein